jgi:hypothetical protein
MTVEMHYFDASTTNWLRKNSLLTICTCGQTPPLRKRAQPVKTVPMESMTPLPAAADNPAQRAPQKALGTACLRELLPVLRLGQTAAAASALREQAKGLAAEVCRFKLPPGH